MAFWTYLGKRDNRYIWVAMLLRHAVPSTTDPGKLASYLDMPASILLPLMIPDDRRDKTSIMVISP